MRTQHGKKEQFRQDNVAMAIAEDIPVIRRNMATKAELGNLHTERSNLRESMDEKFGELGVRIAT
jgi:hypothetical protein